MLRAIVRLVRRAGAQVRLVSHYYYDMRRYSRNASSAQRRLTDEGLRARLFQKAHSIEKGLAMPSVRPAFGKVALLELRSLITEASARGFPNDEPGLAKARHALSAYVAFHRGIEAPLADELGFVETQAAAKHDAAMGGVIALDASTQRAAARGDFSSMALSRHSVRAFAPGAVPASAIEEAIALAMRSPSVCNRQGSRAYRIRGDALKKSALDIQGGNRGFGDGIDTVLVVTNRLEIYRGARERNQCWIDGGLFAMSLLYALHYQGLGACPLNWSADKAQDMELRKLLGLPDSEAIVMLIGTGLLRDRFFVASSPRRSLSDVLVEIPSAPAGGGGDLVGDEGGGNRAAGRELFVDPAPIGR